MEMLLAFIVGPIVVVIVGTVVYCAGAVAIEVVTTPMSLVEDIMENRRKSK